MTIRSVPIENAPRRVVSLVPSLTESFFDLGLGQHIVGITDYCFHPAASLKGICRVGGPKNPDIQQIIDLCPDLVVANQEENSRPDIEALQALEIPVWLTFPLTVDEAIQDLWSLARLYRSERAMLQIRVLEHALEPLSWAVQDAPKVRVFCPIWQDQTKEGLRWWMTFNRCTFSHDLLERLGIENVFRDRERHYPIAADLGLCPPEDAGKRDTRYPRVILEEIVQSRPELVLLPSEPYAFTGEDARFMKTQLEERLGYPIRVEMVDGSLLTWPGTRIGKAIEELTPILLQ